MHSGRYPILYKHIMSPFTLLINWVIFSTPIFSAVHIQFYHIVQMRRKRTYFRLLLKLNICTKDSGKYLKVQQFYWYNSKCHNYVVFQTKPENTDLLTSTLNVPCIQNFQPCTHSNFHLLFSFFVLAGWPLEHRVQRQQQICIWPRFII